MTHFTYIRNIVFRWIIAVTTMLLVTGSSYALQTIPDTHLNSVSEAVSLFYKARNNSPFWFHENNGAGLRLQLLQQIESSETQGLDTNVYHPASLEERMNATSEIMDADRLYTIAAVTYLKDIIGGGTPNGITGSDALSGKESSAIYGQALSALDACADAVRLDSVVKSLEPAGAAYLSLKAALAAALAHHEADTVAILKVAMNSYRRIHNRHYAKCIVVNIPAGRLRYYEQDSMVLEMKVVTGKPSTPTPRFAAYCNQVILYPYWNVPRSIAVNELLPVCKKSPALLSIMNIEVLDATGKLQDPAKINWKRYNRQNFPFRFRQATGCDNALGVIKFNLESPYGVYLHDTNNKLSFAAKNRYFSHGCIRLEKPVALAELLLGTALNRNYLAACLKAEQPYTLQLPSSVPVFVVYVRAEAGVNDSIIYYNDVYSRK